MQGLGALAQLGNMYQGQSFSYGLNAKAASTSWDRWKNMQTRGPKYAMQGLRRAGINPILAAGGGIKAGASGSAVQASASKPFSAGGNPSVDRSQVRLLEAQRQAALEAANVSNAEGALRQMEANYFAENQDKFADAMINKILPDNPTALVAKQLYGKFGQQLKEGFGTVEEIRKEFNQMVDKSQDLLDQGASEARRLYNRGDRVILGPAPSWKE